MVLPRSLTANGGQVHEAPGSQMMKSYGKECTIEMSTTNACVCLAEKARSCFSGALKRGPNSDADTMDCYQTIMPFIRLQQYFSMEHRVTKKHRPDQIHAWRLVAPSCGGHSRGLKK